MRSRRCLLGVYLFSIGSVESFQVPLSQLHVQKVPEVTSSTYLNSFRLFSSDSDDIEKISSNVSPDVKNEVRLLL